MEQIIPKTAYTLGDYYAEPLLRAICKIIKNGQADAQIMEWLGSRLAAIIPDDAILVPIPSPPRYYTERLVKEIAKYKWPGEIPREHHINCTVLDSTKEVSLYDTRKKYGLPFNEEDCQFFLTGQVPDGNIVLVDNVMATGTTVSAAMRLIGRPCSVATIAVDFEAFSKQTKRNHGKESKDHEEQGAGSNNVSC